VSTVDPALSFWPTPPDVAEALVYRVLEPGFGDGGAAGGVPQVRVLEPSAGEGHLIWCVRQHLPGAHITAVEPSPQRAASLCEQGLADEVIESTLEDYLCSVAWSAMAGTFQPFDIVAMNPPFTLSGRPEAWAEHFLAIYHDPYLLAPYGQISAVVPRIVMTGKSKLVRAVRGLLHPYFGIAECERGAFSAVGAQVSTALIWIEKTPTRLTAATGSAQ
jgi:predicted RNA methylase